MSKILVVDDHQNTLEALSQLLKSRNQKHLIAETGEKGYTYFQQNEIDLVITDLKLPGISGIDLLKKIRVIDDQVPVILITAFATIETAVEAMKFGAFDYISKPFSIDEIELKIDKALKNRNLALENRYLHIVNDYLREEVKLNFEEIIGQSNSMKKVYTLIKRLAPSNTPVLITGESGTGKELIARALHYNSPRKNKPFIKLSCAALAVGVLESELFGHEKGAFTDAYRQKLGRFEIAGDGTLFLDEVGEIAPAIQVKLLRVLQEKEFERVGGNDSIKMKARLLTATNQDLMQGIKDKTFREDLYYRLNVVNIEIPPLRNRVNDIPLLVQHFLEKYNRETGKHISKIEPMAMKTLMTYSWPGNVRELENVIERAVVLATKEIIRTDEFPSNLYGNVGATLPDGVSPNLTNRIIEYEKDIISQAFIDNKGNISQAAKLLGIKRTTLRYKLEKYHII
ncbi:MAG: response regulator [Planctomycetia bacterium]|nr:response regulator [Planctomycetia bacterium]